MALPSPLRRRLLPLIALGAAGCSNGTEGASEHPWFTEITAEVGLDFVQESGACGEYGIPEIMGGGVGLFDAEHDGDLDLYCVNGNNKLPSIEVDPTCTNRFYRQDSGGRFVDATRESNLGDGRYGMGLAVGDADNDGDEDVVVTHFGPNTFFANDGSGRFEDATERAGIAGSGWSSSAAFFDLDRDGFLDLFVVRYVEYDPREKCFNDSGERDYCGPKAFPPVHDLLFRNRGQPVPPGGTGPDPAFEDVTHAAGVDSLAAAGLGVVCADFDEDGWQDVYVANDAYAGHLWINRHDGSLREEALQRGVAFNLNGQSQAGMGIVAADFDGNLRLDLFKTHLRHETNTLYLSRGDGDFVDSTGSSGLGPSSMPFTGFGTAAIDFDHDRELDVVVVNGAVVHGKRFPGVELPSPWDTYAEPNLFYRGEGGARFQQADRLAGTLASRVEISRGLAAGDVDGDGDQDLLVGKVEGPARLYRNDAPSEGPPRHWIALRCIHPGWRRDALGARVEISACGRTQIQVLSSSWSYLSSSPPVAHFGLGDCASVEHVDVLWPDGARERFRAPAVDRLHPLVRGAGGE